MKTFNKTALLLAVAWSALLVAGCKNDQLPRALNDAQRTITLVTKGASGVLVRDAEGKLYAYDETYYFSEIINDSELKRGDEIVGNDKTHRHE